MRVMRGRRTPVVVLVTSNEAEAVGEGVPTPNLPSTKSPLTGAALVPEYDEPITAFPAMSTLL